MVKIGEFTIEPADPSRNDIILSNPESDTTATTRRVMRPDFFDNPGDPSARISVTLMHQKRSRKSARSAEHWEDADHFDLRRLGDDEQIKMDLKAGQTKRMLFGLLTLYSQAGTLASVLEEWIDAGNQLPSLLFVSGQKRQIIEDLVRNHPDELWDHVEAIAPNIARAHALKRQFARRTRAIDTFRAHLRHDDWNELQWGRFFSRNRWIFGHNLLFQFLEPVQDQPVVGRVRIDGGGGQRPDFMVATAAARKFTVLVEIKRPSAALLVAIPYRNHAFVPGEDVIGGVAQLQSSCRTWETIGAQMQDNEEWLRIRQLETVQPRGILIVGNQEQLISQDEKDSFELYRRNLANPEILTYDELLQRAKLTVQIEEELF